MFKKKAVVSLVAGVAMLAGVGTSVLVFAQNNQKIPKNVLLEESKPLLSNGGVANNQNDNLMSETQNGESLEKTEVEEGYLSLDAYVASAKEAIWKKYGMEAEDSGFYHLFSKSTGASVDQQKEEVYQDLVDQFKVCKEAKFTWWEHGVSEPQCIVMLIDQEGTVLTCESYLKEHKAKPDSYLSYEEYVKIAVETIKKEYGADVTTDNYMPLFYTVPEKVEKVDEGKNYEEMKAQFELNGSANMTWWEIGADRKYIVSVQPDGSVSGYGIAE